MALLNIVKEGDDVLRKKSKPVAEITPKIITLLDDMRDTLIKADGCGLAAVQVGILRRIFIINDGDEDNPHIVEFINPELIKKEGHQEEAEGCLSVPGKYGITSRPMTVTAKATDRNGNEFTYTGTGLYGRALCHEYDHLDGILYIDHAVRMLDPEEVE